MIKAEYPEQFQATDRVLELLPPLDDTDIELRNPIVHRTLTEMRRVVNAVIRQYGKPDLIRLELARNLKNSGKERERITRNNRDQEKKRAGIAAAITREAGITSPSRRDILKVMLAEECDFTCPYTGRRFSMHELLHGGLMINNQNIVTANNMMGVVNDIAQQIEERYIKDPDYTIELVNTFLDALLDTKISEYPCAKFVGEYGFGSNSRPGNLGDLMFSIFVYKSNGNEDISDDPFMQDVLARLQSGELVTEPENAIFHARRMKSYFDDGDQLIIMVATNERDIYKKYKHLLQNEGAVVYLVDEENRVLSSNMEKEIGQYLDKALVKGIENNSSEVELDGKYLIDSEYMEDSGMRLVHLYPKNMLATQVLEGIRPYVALCIGLIVVCLLSAVLIGLRTTRFLDEFVWAMNSVRRKNYDVKIRKYKDPEIDRLGEAFNQMTAEIKELIQNKYESQILLNEMEIRFLQHQMNPHFLFNVLLTIQIKAKRCKDETIYHMVSTLSSLLRASIYTNNIEMITVREELEYAEFYLYLQKMRFDDRISYEVTIEDDSLKECMRRVCMGAKAPVHTLFLSMSTVQTVTF